LYHQVSDKRLARARRAEATLSPQGGGSDKVRSGRKEAARQQSRGGVQIKQCRKATREMTGGRRAEDREAKSGASWTCRTGFDTEEKELKGTGFKGQSK